MSEQTTHQTRNPPTAMPIPRFGVGPCRGRG
jgi:hypothetical protein